jgi:hypothetical protein
MDGLVNFGYEERRNLETWQSSDGHRL